MASKGQNKLEAIVRDLLPLETIVKEFHIGEKLRLDLYYPKYDIAFEYHGRQHFEYVEHFHKDIYGFQESIARDQKKEELCVEHGIVLLVFRYDDSLDEAEIGDKIREAIETDKSVKSLPPKRRPWPKEDKTTPYHKEQIERQKKYRQESYRKMKELKKKD